VTNRILIIGSMGGLEAQVISLLAEAGHNVVLVNDHTVYNVPRTTPGEFMVVEGQHRPKGWEEMLAKVTDIIPAPPMLHWHEKKRAQWKDEVQRSGVAPRNVSRRR
jgi:hypothetical protein